MMVDGVSGGVVMVMLDEGGGGVGRGATVTTLGPGSTSHGAKNMVIFLFAFSIKPPNLKKNEN